MWMLRVPVLGGFFLSLGRGENGKCTGNETVFLAGQSGQDRVFTDFFPCILATGMLSLLEILGKVVSMIRLMKPVYP